MDKEQQNNLELLNCTEVARFLGVKTETIYVWMCKKQLPQKIYRKLGRKPIFIKSEVEKWILDGALMEGC
jgi:predicted DNA-binding transcriptional regulator AlpA